MSKDKKPPPSSSPKTGGGPRPSAPEVAAPPKVAQPTVVARLTAEEQEIVEELTGEAMQTNALIDAHVTRLGGRIFLKAFKSSTEAVLDEETSPNPIWRELCRRAGGSTLRMSEEGLQIALRIAVWDKGVNDDNFRQLDIERKKLLLPLAKAELLREAAQHVTDLRLTYRATKRYVKNLRTAAGTPPATRVSEQQVSNRLKGVNDRFGTVRDRQSVARMAAKLPKENREALKRELEEAIAALQATQALLGK